MVPQRTREVGLVTVDAPHEPCFDGPCNGQRGWKRPSISTVASHRFATLTWSSEDSDGRQSLGEVPSTRGWGNRGVWPGRRKWRGWKEVIRGSQHNKGALVCCSLCPSLKRWKIGRTGTHNE